MSENKEIKEKKIRFSNYQDDDLDLEEYTKPKRYQTKFWMWIILGVIFVLMAYIYKATILDKTIPPEELVSSIKIFGISSQWVESEKVDTPDYKGLIIVPEITFRVRNVGKQDLSYVYFLGVFRLMNRSKPLGEDYMMAFKKPLKPNEESEPMRLRSKFGFRAKSLRAFKQQSKEWRGAMVQFFVRSGTSGMSPLKTFYISRRIKGLEIDIKVTGQTIDEVNSQLTEDKKNETSVESSGQDIEK